MAAPETKSRSSWPLYLIGALFAVGVIGTIFWNVELPYLAFSAGPVSDAADSVIVEDLDVYPPEGELLMLTVVSQDVNVFEAVIAGLDPTIDLVRKQAVRRAGESDEEYRNRVLEQMSSSNLRSVVVALEYLDLDVPTDVVISGIREDVPAAEVLQLGDEIVAVNGEPVTTSQEIVDLIAGLEVGDTLEMTVERRDGETTTVNVELAEREEEPGVPMIGVVLGPGFPVDIEAGDVGGPSAGMMHALAIIDILTEGELTKGHVIAGTGTIQDDGSVGSIGGIRQKVVAAEAAGASHILVPAGNYESALTAERERIEIVPVATIDEAIGFLDSLEPA